MLTVQVVKTDITNESTMAITNATNSKLILSGRVGEAINRKGGPSI